MSVKIDLEGLWCAIRDGVALMYPRLREADMRIVVDDHSTIRGLVIAGRDENVDALDDDGKPIGAAGTGL